MQYIFTVLAAVISAKEIWRFPYTVMGHDSECVVKNTFISVIVLQYFNRFD